MKLKIARLIILIDGKSKIKLRLIFFRKIYFILGVLFSF